MTAPSAKLYRTASGRLVSFGFDPMYRQSAKCIAWSTPEGAWERRSDNDAGIVETLGFCVPDHVILDGENLVCFLPNRSALWLTYVGAPVVYRVSVAKPEGAP